MRYFGISLLLFLVAGPSYGQGDLLATPFPQHNADVPPSPDQSKPILPWPIVSILARENDAACEIEKLLVESSDAAGKEAQRVVDEKDAAIKEQQGIAKNANDKRKEGDLRIETGMSRTGFSFDMPETVVSFEDTTIGTIHIKIEETSLLVPAIGQCALGKWDVPEFRGFDITMKTQTVYVPCPTQKKVVLSLPQFTAGRTTIRLPQVKIRMARKDVSFHVPQVTYRDWEKVENAARKKASIEEELAKQALEEIKARHKGKTAEAIRQSLKQMYEAAMAELDARYKADIETIDEQYRKFVEVRNQAQKDLLDAGSDPNASFPFDEVEVQFTKYRADLREPYEKARATINGNFDTLTTRYLGPVVHEMGGGPFCGEPQSTPALSLSP